MESNLCKSCGTPLTETMYSKLRESIRKGNKDHTKVFKELDIAICCRTVLLTSSNIMPLLPFL